MGVSAAPAHYECLGYRGLDADFTPAKAQVRFDGAHWELHRVRDSRGAMYVDRRAGVRVTVSKGLLTLDRGDEHVPCRLVSQALRPENLGVPARAASAPGSAPAGR